MKIKNIQNKKVNNNSILNNKNKNQTKGQVLKIKNNPIGRIKISPNYINLIKYNQHLNKSKIQDTNQIILITKKDKLSIQNVKVVGNKNKTQITSNLNSNNKKYFTQIDMLSLKKSEKQSLSAQHLPNIVSDINFYINEENKDTIKNPNLKINNIKKGAAPQEGESLLLINTPSAAHNNLKVFFKNFNLDIVRSHNIIYKFNNSRKKIITNIYSILENSFLTMSSIISKPLFNITPKKVVIHLFFFLVKKNKKLYRSKYNKFLDLNKKKLELLCANLSKLLEKPVELDIVKLYSPSSESTILANILGRISDLTYRPYRKIMERLFTSAKIKNPRISIPKSDPIIPSFVTGLRIKLGGRLLKSKIIPRISFITTQRGSLTRSSADIISKGRFTTKNKRGTFSFTATIGHRFY
uniref:Small ribosomal subunit protein uS3m n=1 Tax=Sparassis crispa TaxID=139825 RepID=A0A6N0GSG1_9APHY|nr:ribosomal protein S3 [Sparassis crispa]